MKQCDIDKILHISKEIVLTKERVFLLSAKQSVYASPKSARFCGIIAHALQEQIDNDNVYLQGLYTTLENAKIRW